MIIDDLGHNKYRVKVDGSGRVTDRNRQFLRQFLPATPVQPGPRPGNDFYPEPTPPVTQHLPPVVSNPEPVVSNPEPVMQPTPQTPERPAPQPIVQQTPETPGSPSFATPPTTPVPNILPRRSTRVIRPPDKWGYDRF